MPAHGFDELLDALSSSASDAQKAVSRRQQGQLRRLISGKNSENLTWTFYVPSERSDDESSYRPIEMPLISMRTHQEFQISELSIELVGRAKRTSTRSLRHQADDNVKDGALASEMPNKRLAWVITLDRISRALDPQLTRIKILWRKISSPTGRVFVNDRELRAFEGKPARWSASEPQKTGSILDRRKIKLLFSPEDSHKLDEILLQDQQLVNKVLRRHSLVTLARILIILVISGFSISLV